MIRAWLRRRQGVSRGVQHAVDEVAFLGAQIEGLRDALAGAQRQLADERCYTAVLLGQLATYKAREWAAHAARLRLRLVEESTLRTSVADLRAARPAAPTEQYRRPR